MMRRNKGPTGREGLPGRRRTKVLIGLPTAECCQGSYVRPYTRHPTGRGGVSILGQYLHQDCVNGCRGPLVELTQLRVPPVEEPERIAFKEYKEIPRKVTIDFMEDDVTWVTSELLGDAGDLGVEAIELRN